MIWESMDDFDDMVGMYVDDMTKVDVDVDDNNDDVVKGGVRWLQS